MMLSWLALVAVAPAPAEPPVTDPGGAPSGPAVAPPTAPPTEVADPDDEEPVPATDKSEDPPKRPKPANSSANAPRGKPGSQAAGGQGYTPLPPPPSSEDPASISRGAWRGRFWVEMRLDIGVPVGGEQPARGDVVSGGGSIGFGWRINNWVGVYAGVSHIAHSQQTRSEFNEFDEVVKVTSIGRLTAFDIGVARLYLPTDKRFQPFAEVGAGASLVVPPFANVDDGLWGGHGRFGLGFDGWVTPNFTIGVLGVYRLLGLDRTIGHALLFGVNVGAHW